MLQKKQLPWYILYNTRRRQNWFTWQLRQKYSFQKIVAKVSKEIIAISFAREYHQT